MNRWASFRERAAHLGGEQPEEVGWLRALDERLLAIGQPAVSEWWHETLVAYWRSGRPYFACEKGQRSQASTTLAETLIVESFMRSRTLMLDQRGICAFVAVTTRESDSAIGATIPFVMRALGLSEVKRDDPTPETYAPTSTDWRAIDADGHSIVFQLRPPSKGAAAAGTFVGYLADEVNLWRTDQSLRQPADKVLEILQGRPAYQPGAHGYHTSTPEGRDGALSTIIRASLRRGSESVHIARLGELGARRDDIARRGLRAHLSWRARDAPEPETRASCLQWAADERLARDPDPRATNIPTWSARGGEPVAEILECWRRVDVALRDGDAGGDPLDVLMHRYGAQPGGDVGRRVFGEQLLAEAKARQIVWR